MSTGDDRGTKPARRDEAVELLREIRDATRENTATIRELIQVLFSARVSPDDVAAGRPSAAAPTTALEDVPLDDADLETRIAAVVASRVEQAKPNNPVGFARKLTSTFRAQVRSGFMGEIEEHETAVAAQASEPKRSRMVLVGYSDHGHADYVTEEQARAMNLTVRGYRDELEARTRRGER